MSTPLSSSERTPEGTTLNNVLHYSYDPSCRRRGLPDEIAEAATEETISATSDSLESMAIEAFREAVATELQDVPGGATHVIPLSAGLDSRAILAVLLNIPSVDASQIHTVTFGSPGTWDYEIGSRVAAEAGVENTQIDVTGEEFDWSLDALRRYAATRDCPGGVFDGYVNRQIPSIVPPDSVIWSGYTGSLTAGAFQPADPCETWEQALTYFADDEQFATGLTAPDFDPRTSLPDEPFIARSKLSYEEQLDFALRQQCATGPVVINAENYRCPFTTPAWLKFGLNLPAEHRRSRSLFAEAFSTAYPELFALPTDANGGYPPTVGPLRVTARLATLRVLQTASSTLGLEYTDPRTNYLDFESAFRSGPLRDVGRQLIEDFADRGVADWIDPRAIWREHLSGTDRATEIQVICYAELHLETSST